MRNHQEANMRARIVAQGVVAGFLGYLVIVVSYSTLNLLQGRPVLATAAHLGGLLLGHGAPAPGAGVDPGAIIAFNGVHLVAALLAGVIGSLIVTEWELHPAAGYLFFFIMLTGFVAGAFWSAILISELAQVVAWTTVLVIDALAAAVMGVYLFRAHPGIVAEAAQIGEA
jgi:hypothetical protein